ncbi:hypothetical protein F4861DRAFT_499860 [Xylaria intraflava]|nr:hypothetical protein F4861DRAFT_499860 [Xylaria intraflava]
MYSRRFIQLLMVALSILIATRASWFHNDVQPRQVTIPDLGGGGDNTNAADSSSAASTAADSPTSSQSDAPATTTDNHSSSSTDSPSTNTPTPTASPTTSSSDAPPPPPPPPSTSSSETGPITTSPTQKPTSTPPPSTSSDSSSPATSDSSPTTTAKPITLTQTVLRTSTNSQGATTVESSESVVVSTPGLSGNSGSKSSSGGITPTTRNTIIGVTVGVGGAIVIAAAGLLYWRLRSKRRTQEENEELITYGAGFGGPGTAEKTEPSGPVRSPFQSTLETYHAPSQTNAASNF